MFLKYIKLQQLLKTVRKMFWLRLVVTSRHYQVKSEKLIKNEIKKVNKTIREKVFYSRGYNTQRSNND